MYLQLQNGWLTQGRICAVKSWKTTGVIRRLYVQSKGKITTIAGFLRNSFGHDHPPSNETTVKFVSTMRKRARSETTPRQQIFNDELMKEADQDIPDIPTFPIIKSSMYRQRRTMMPVLPQTLQDVDLQGPWSQTHDGKRFVLFSDGDADKMVVFSTEDQLRLLQEADTIYMDDDARFPLRMWNHFTNAGPRTNNNVEGFHSRVNRLLPHRHPNIYRFVELIKGIDKCERAKLIQINAGAPPPPRRRVYRELDTRVRRLKQRLTDRTKTPLQYLDAIGHLMKLQ